MAIALLRLFLVIFLVGASSVANAQGDIFGSNRQDGQAAPARSPEETRRPSNVPYRPDPNAELRLVRLLGDGVVYRLEPPDAARAVHHDMSAIRTVVCAEPPCDVWLPLEASLAVQRRGRDYALGRLTLPPGPGQLRADITWTRRIVAGVLIAATVLGGLAFFIAAGAQDADSLLNLQPLFLGAGVGLMLGGLLTGGILLAQPLSGSAQWRGAGAGRGWH